MNTSTKFPAAGTNDLSGALLGLIGRVTGRPASTLKGSLRGYYQAVPSLLGESFLGPLVSTTVFSKQLKARALSEGIYQPLFEAMSRWERWDEPLAEALLREVVPTLLGVTSMQRRDNDSQSVGMALGQLAGQAGEGKVRLTSLVCPSYQYRRDANGKLWHSSGELLPTTGARFGKVAATLGRIFAPLTALGIGIRWEFWSYTGETGDPEHLIDMGRFVQQHYQDDPRQLFETLAQAARDMDRQLREQMCRYGIEACGCSLDRKFGALVLGIRRDFSAAFPDQQDEITNPEGVEAWLDEVSGCGRLIRFFIDQEKIYRQNVLIDFTEPMVSASLREMLLYTCVLEDIRANGTIVIDTESTSNYMTEVLRFLPAGVIFTRSEKEGGDDATGTYTLNIRQPYNVVPC